MGRCAFKYGCTRQAFLLACHTVSQPSEISTQDKLLLVRKQWKNAFEAANFWWQLSLTAWFSNMFHGAFHTRKGFLSAELSVCQDEGSGDSFLWTQVEKPPQWRARQRENTERGGRMQTAYLWPLQAQPEAWGPVFSLPTYLSIVHRPERPTWIVVTGQSNCKVTLHISVGHRPPVWLQPNFLNFLRAWKSLASPGFCETWWKIKDQKS